MRSALMSLLGSFLSPWGVVLIAALDASLVFFLPLGVDIVVILLSARHPATFWLYALLAMIGSVIGAAGTFWIGRKIGEGELAKLVKPRRLERVKARVNKGTAVVAALALIPPPFPFTPFVPTGGALEMNPWSFLGTLSVARLVRFGLEATLAASYGTRIVRWMHTSIFEGIVGVFIALALIGTVVSALGLARETRSVPRRRQSA